MKMPVNADLFGPGGYVFTQATRQPRTVPFHIQIPSFPSIYRSKITPSLPLSLSLSLFHSISDFPLLLCSLELRKQQLADLIKVRLASAESADVPPLYSKLPAPRPNNRTSFFSEIWILRSQYLSVPDIFRFETIHRSWRPMAPLVSCLGLQWWDLRV
ncbi:hypothetical protein VN97_g3434 [Penicillium thymicola]|uniref:Uncharacterized protein n=1 Tax=Penicillium thymicola TaxID=293382 RepID=A0AAI9XAT5_PENTH|nr:hypothetical protein VN97_g3434 [Penicillium thymicola]